MGRPGSRAILLKRILVLLTIAVGLAAVTLLVEPEPLEAVIVAVVV